MKRHQLNSCETFIYSTQYLYFHYIFVFFSSCLSLYTSICSFAHENNFNHLTFCFVFLVFYENLFYLRFITFFFHCWFGLFMHSLWLYCFLNAVYLVRENEKARKVKSKKKIIINKLKSRIILPRFGTL